MEQGKSRSTEGSSQSWRPDDHRREGKEVRAVVDEFEIGDIHVINGIHQLHSEKGVKIKGIRRESIDGGTVNQLPYMTIQEGEKLTQTNREIEVLTEGIDKVEIFRFGSKEGAKNLGVQNLVDVPIQNESTQMVQSK